MAEFKKIGADLKHGGQVLNLILNAPKGNVLDREMMTGLMEAIKQKGNEPAVKALVFQGEGDHFSFGASISEHQKEFVPQMLAAFHDLFRTLIKVNKPSFALVRGQCLGGGLELAAFCHWIFASEDAKFGQPEINLAVILPYRIGQSAADDLVLSGRSITAQEAKQLGLVYSLSIDPQAELSDFISKHILPKSGAALQFAVQASRYEMYQAFLKNLDAIEKMYVRELMEAEDANEGIKAFMEKRMPVWKNR
jgi:cyclohexa-1,5-dienecarbonyl-CoA hydratase